jgi:hypothetical protein
MAGSSVHAGTQLLIERPRSIYLKVSVDAYLSYGSSVDA